MLVDVLANMVSGAITDLIVHLWSQTSLSQDDRNRNRTLKALTSPIEDPFQRDDVEKQFIGIGKDIARRLKTLFDLETRDKNDINQETVAMAVAEVLNEFNLDMPRLLSKNLNAKTLERHILDHSGNETKLFSEAETALFESVIRYTCDYIVDIAAELPAFQANAIREILEREDDTRRRINRILEQVDKLIKNSYADIESGTDDTFKRLYLNSVHRNLNHMNLFGTDVSITKEGYPLNVAYIQLSATIVRQNSELRSFRIEELLNVDRRFLLRGDAGSGKTTILKWIACRAARGEFDEALQYWNKIPFFIRLREFADKKLPTLEELPQLLDDALGDAPKHWVRSKLRAGQAIILIDGVDEIQKRDDVKKWIKDLIGNYGEYSNRFLVTSRPTAVEGNWLMEENFQDAQLEPLQRADIHELIDHWHQAIAVQAKKSNTILLATRLKHRLEHQHNLRQLATTPLLCALICAIHYELDEKKQQLPENRLELYKTCIEMFIHKQDVAKRILESENRISAFPELKMEQKQELLQALAYQMIVNNESEISFTGAEHCFENCLNGMRRLPPEITPGQVREFLMIRSGLLKSPAEKTLSFAHRTFQEYFAAIEVVRLRRYGQLVNQAGDDRWREVIILAVGRGDDPGRQKVLTGIIEKGDQYVIDQELEYGHRLYLTAAACLESGFRLEPPIQKLIYDRLAEVIPPQYETAVKALAAARELAVPYLTLNSDWNIRQQVLSARALGLIGTTGAEKKLRVYSKSQHSEVIKEVIESLMQFEPEIIGPHVSDYDTFNQDLMRQTLLWLVAESSKTYSSQIYSLPHLNYLTSQLVEVIISEIQGLHSLSLDLDLDLSFLPEMTQLQSLTLSFDPALSHVQLLDLDLSFLSEMTQLQSLALHLDLTLSHDLDLSFLPEMTQLQSLSLDRAHDLSFLPEMTQLRSLALSRAHDLSFLPEMTQLRSLALDISLDVTLSRDLSFLSEMEQLQSLSLDLSLARKLDLALDLSFLPEMTQLRSLALVLDSAYDLSFLSEMIQLQSLALHLDSACDLGFLSEMTQLQSLSLDLALSRAYDLSFLSEMEQLQSLALHLDSACDLGFLSEMTQLQSLALHLSRHFSLDIKLGFLRELTKLRNFTIQGDCIIAGISLHGLMMETNIQHLNLFGLAWEIPRENSYSNFT